MWQTQEKGAKQEDNLTYLWMAKTCMVKKDYLKPFISPSFLRNMPKEVIESADNTRIEQPHRL
jgi:hypothetical protein